MAVTQWMPFYRRQGRAEQAGQFLRGYENLFNTLARWQQIYLDYKYRQRMADLEEERIGMERTRTGAFVRRTEAEVGLTKAQARRERLAGDLAERTINTTVRLREAEEKLANANIALTKANTAAVTMGNTIKDYQIRQLAGGVARDVMGPMLNQFNQARQLAEERSQISFTRMTDSLRGTYEYLDAPLYEVVDGQMQPLPDNYGKADWVDDKLDKLAKDLKKRGFFEWKWRLSPYLANVWTERWQRSGYKKEWDTPTGRAQELVNIIQDMAKADPRLKGYKLEAVEGRADKQIDVTSLIGSGFADRLFEAVKYSYEYNTLPEYMEEYTTGANWMANAINEFTVRMGRIQSEDLGFDRANALVYEWITEKARDPAAPASFQKAAAWYVAQELDRKTKGVTFDTLEETLRTLEPGQAGATVAPTTVPGAGMTLPLPTGVSPALPPPIQELLRRQGMLPQFAPAPAAETAQPAGIDTTGYMIWTPEMMNLYRGFLPQR